MTFSTLRPNFNHSSGIRTRVNVDVSFVIATTLDQEEADTIKQRIEKAVRDLWITDSLCVDVHPVVTCEHNRWQCDDCAAMLEVTRLAVETGVMR